MAAFVVRPSNSEKEAFRVKLTAASLLGLKLKPGDLCILRRDVDAGHNGSELGYAVAWEAPGGMKDNVMQTSKFLQDLYEFKLGEKLLVKKSEDVMEDASVVMIAPKGDEPLPEKMIAFWEEYARMTVAGMHEYLAPGQTLSFKIATENQQFEVVADDSQDALLRRISEQTRFQIATTSSSPMNDRILFTSSQLGGLQNEILEMQKLVDRLLKPRASKGLSPEQGVLVYGARGVGKSHFIAELSKSGWKKVIQWKPGMTVSTPKQSTLIAIRRRDVAKAQDGSRNLLDELESLFATARGGPCLIVGECLHPNDVHPDLRSNRTFGVEIEIPIPSAAQRKEILFAICGNAHIPLNWVIDPLAERTHGYVAADLYKVLRLTLDLSSEQDTPPANGESDTISAEPESPYPVSTADINHALSQVRPSALQEIFLETPKTKWSDIGGQHDIKRQLQHAVERPLKQAKQMESVNLPPKKGLLMYGPPGCSKTLLVRALAREAGLNFLAVKGAELISMYVGESERAVREIFRKARASSPSIIFFDEIDSIASRGRPGGELNVLTTLLNEMDGFEELRNVFVVAATNKPEAIDPALLRPGRFDNVVYVGPPDVEARKEIFQTQFEKSSYRPKESVQADAQYWADRTDGFSGAEVVAIRITACEMSLDEEDVRDWYGFEHMERALKVTTKSITKSVLDGFERWRAARMS